MEEIIARDVMKMTPEYSDAVATHERIKANAQLAASALGEMAKALKHMRDEKLYLQLGFETFGDYVENNQDYSFKERQAYTYIKAYEELGDKFLQSNAELGITKLELLTKIPAYERQEFADEIAGLSVKEVEDLIKTKQDLGEQLTLLEQANVDLKKQLAEKPIEVVQAISEQAEKEKEQAIAEALKKAERHSDSEKKKLKQDFEQQLKQLNADSKKEIESLKQSLEAALVEKEQLTSEREQLRKKLSTGSPDEMKIAIKLYFEEVQKDLSAFIEKVRSIENAEEKEKFRTAALKWLEMISKSLENI